METEAERVLEKVSPPSAPADDPRWALVERVSASPTLQRAPRQRELLHYLCECAIQEPEAHIPEQQVGVAVFGRRPGYDTNADTIVRVQVSQLRRKIEHHFVAEGRDEPIVIELPKGSYMPLFRRRAHTADVGIPVARSPGRSWRLPGWRRVAAVAAGLSLVALLFVRRPWPATEREPHVRHFWSQVTGGRPTQVVLSDMGVTTLADLRGRPIVLDEYVQRTYPAAVVAEVSADANVRSVLEHAAVKGFTNAQDVPIAHALAAACERQVAVPTTIVSARYLKLDLARSENLVLLGNRRSNPWMELFERPLNFRYRFDEENRQAVFDNRSPAGGEKSTYGVDWGRRGHCLVAYVPKPRGPGAALLVAATDWISVSAGGQFITDEGSLAGLYHRLGRGLSDRLPYFELLLEADLAGTTATTYWPVTHRLVPVPIDDSSRH
jgi:hypothetical protein